MMPNDRRERILLDFHPPGVMYFAAAKMRWSRPFGFRPARYTAVRSWRPRRCSAATSTRWRLRAPAPRTWSWFGATVGGAAPPRAAAP
eukprot:7379076-Prymnesium_polylepis.1